MKNVIWQGDADGEQRRIVQFEVNDCVVEARGTDGVWDAVDSDDEAAFVYMTALLEHRREPWYQIVSRLLGW